MINDDVLIKIARKTDPYGDWPEMVILMKKRIHEMKLGFPGLGDDHFSIVSFSSIQVGDYFIWDAYFGCPVRGDLPPTMYSSLNGTGDCKIQGIGCGYDLQRDPLRIKFRWNDVVNFSLPPESLVFRVDVKPTINGGPGYYYFFRSYRDFRY